MSDQLISALLKLGLNHDQVASLAAGAMWFDQLGGVPAASYWSSEKLSMRDEFFLVANMIFALAGIAHRQNVKDDLLAYQVVFLYFLKPNAQSILSIDTLIDKACYGDAFAVCRSLHARINLMLLMSLAPKIFNDWLEHPKAPRYLEGHVRSELSNQGISTMSHTYKLASEVIHNQYQANSDIGYFEQGLIPAVPAIANQVWVIAKFILGAAAYSLLKFSLLSPADGGDCAEMKEMEKYFAFLQTDVLAPNRFEHLWAAIGEERHWTKIGKDKFAIGGLFDYGGYGEQLEKFRLPKGKGQRKQLGKEYASAIKNG